VLRLPAKYRADTAAYASYLRGVTLRFGFHFLEARDTIDALVNRDPLYVPGLYELAHIYSFIALYELANPDETWPKVNSLTRRAIELDSTAASAWLLLASEAQFTRLDVAHADEHIARAHTLDSLDNDVAGMRSVWFRFFGQMDSSIAYARLAHQLEPLAILHTRLLGRQLYLARRYNESQAVFEEIMSEDPGSEITYTEIADVYRELGRPREAVKWFRRAREVNRDSAGAALLHAAASDSEALRLIAGDARRTIVQLDAAVRNGRRESTWKYATAFAALGDTLATLRWLDSMLVRHDGFWSHQVRLDPLFDFLRRDVRYRAWEARSGLPPLVPSGDCRLTEAC
jgi:tetratricopeptide (TPR) repeat protein